MTRTYKGYTISKNLNGKYAIIKGEKIIAMNYSTVADAKFFINEQY